jgi:hypothetical protein
VINSHAQTHDSIQKIEKCICNETIMPLGYTHIINLRSGRGTTSDSSGNFILSAFPSDSILFRNLAYEEQVLIAGEIIKTDTIHMNIRLYAIKEVRIYEWGSTYADFGAKMKSMPVTENLGQKLGLPQQTGNPIPNYRNPAVLSNPMFAITNPIDFLYFNLNKQQQSIRKVDEFKRNEELIRKFESVFNRIRIAELTGLSGKELDTFLVYLNQKFQCDFNCTEIQIISEIYRHWENYKK